MNYSVDFLTNWNFVYGKDSRMYPKNNTALRSRTDCSSCKQIQERLWDRAVQQATHKRLNCSLQPSLLPITPAAARGSRLILPLISLYCSWWQGGAAGQRLVCWHVRAAQYCGRACSQGAKGELVHVVPWGYTVQQQGCPSTSCRGGGRNSTETQCSRDRGCKEQQGGPMRPPGLMAPTFVVAASAAPASLDRGVCNLQQLRAEHPCYRTLFKRTHCGKCRIQSPECHNFSTQYQGSKVAIES